MNKPLYYFDQYNMLRTKDEPHWQVDDGKGDALFGTSMAYMIYGSEFMKNGIMSCFKPVDGGIEILRHPTTERSDGSRDQLSAALIALKYHNHLTDIRWITSRLKWRLSDRFRQTIDLHFWIRGLTGDVFYTGLFHLLIILQMVLIVPWNRLVRHVCGFKPQDQKDYTPDGYFRLPKWKQRATKLMFPTYALFLMVLQIYVSDHTLLKPIIKRMIKKEVERSNTVLMNLLGYRGMDFTYKSMRGLRWNDRLDVTNNNSLRIIKDGEIGNFDLDYDMLLWSYRL